MGLSATLSVVDRAPRRDLSVSATMRVDRHPVDVEVMNISATGFRARCPAELQPGDTVLIGASGLGRREATVIWADMPIYGFQFDQPVDGQTLTSVRQTDNVLSLPIDAEPSAESPHQPGEQDHRTMPLVIGAALSLGMAMGYTVKAIWDGLVAPRRRR